MKQTARDLSRKVLLRVADGAYATLALSGELTRSQLSKEDRALCTEIVYGVLRQRLYLDHVLSLHTPRGLSKVDPMTREVLRIAAYQLLCMRVAPHAAVHEAVQTVRRLRGERLANFVNAVLRALSAAGAPTVESLSPDPMERLSIQYSLPLPLVRDALRRLGPPSGEKFLKSMAEPPPIWLRLNLKKGSKEQALSALSAEVPKETLIPTTRLPEAVKTRGQELFTGAAYGAGWFIAQDLGAQIVAHVLSEEHGLQGPLSILDACAGVGGKSTHLVELLGNGVEVDAADLSERKLELCAEHVRRLGCKGVRIVRADLTNEDAPLAKEYAAVLLDAPCSGLGVLRRHPEARWRFDPATIMELAAIQKRLLRALARRVRKGGLLVYSVCTYTDEEGPRQIAEFLRDVPSFQLEALPQVPVFAGLQEGVGALRTWPHRDDADAFYVARLRKLG